MTMLCARAIHLCAEMPFLKLCRVTFAGLSALSCILVLLMLVSFLFHSKLRIYSNVNENIYDEAKNVIVPLLPSTQVQRGSDESRGKDSNYALMKPVTPNFLKQHVFQTVNWYPINTSYDVIPEKKYMIAEAKSIYFSVKTTQKNHSVRLPILLLTWMQTVLPSQVCSNESEFCNIATKILFRFTP